MSTKVVPNNPETEEFLLSCVLIDGLTSLSLCLNRGVNAQTFYTAANRVIFERLLVMMSEGKPIELATLAQELTIAKEMDQVGGYAYLAQISGRIPTTAQVGYFIDSLIEMQTLRTGILLATSMVEGIYNYSGGGVGKLIQTHLAKMLNLAVGGSQKQDLSYPKLLEEAKTQAKAIITKKGPDMSRCMQFPLEDMNKLFYAMERGQLVILSGPPSSGKSSLARQIAVKVSDDLHGDVYFVTMEVAPARVILNIAQSESKVSIKKLGTEHKETQKDFLALIDRMQRHRFHISNTDRSLGRVVGRARAIHAKAVSEGKSLAMIVIDHGLLFDEVVNGDPTTMPHTISKITGTLKSLAVELDCVALLLWQLTGSAIKLGTGFRSSDMKGSSALEADADKIIMVQRPENDPRSKMSQNANAHVDDQPIYYQELVQTKGRDDGSATIGVEFKRAIATFCQIPATNVGEQKPKAEDQQDIPF